MGSLIRQFGFGKANSPVAQKLTGILNDGTRVACVLDMNQTGVTGDGGDGTGVPKAYFYTSSNGVTWTLRATITISVPTTLSTRILASMSIGANNNIHFVYRNSAHTLIYQLLTWSAGPAYAVGAAETLTGSAPAAGEFYPRVDIDVAGTGNNAIVAAHLSRTVTTKSLNLRVWYRNNTPAWSSFTQVAMISNDYHFNQTDEISISANQDANDGSNINTAAIALVKKSAGGIDYGDEIFLVKATMTATTGPTVVSGVKNFNVNIGGGIRKPKLHWVATDTWILCEALNVLPYRVMVGKFSMNRTTNGYTQQVAWTNTYPGFNADRTVETFHWHDSAYVGNSKVVFVRRAPSYRDVSVATLNTNGSVTWSNSGFQEEKYLPTGSVPAAAMWIGTPRNIGLSLMPQMTAFYTNGSFNAYRMEWKEKDNPVAGTVLAPTSGSTIVSNKPTLRGTHKWAINNPPYRTKLQFQVATDSGFSTNLRTITEPDSDLISAYNTLTSTTVKSDEAISSLNQLFTANWFLRVRALDETGFAGPWSSSISFTVSHPPVGANLFPTGNRVFVYGAGAVTFTWDFTDPAPGDYQTAYQVIISDAASGAILVDTGKVSSANKTTSPLIPVASKDLQLQWTLQLWDSDNAPGPLSTPQLFTVTDSPIPVIVTPSAGQVLTAANPTISWTTGIATTKVQTQYRVYVSSGGLIIYDSGLVNSSNTSHQIPTGYLSNNGAYTVSVYVKDSYNLTATATQLFTTSWTPPTSRSLSSIYLAYYSKFGYVHIVLDPTGFDPDFFAWNIYRRKYGDTAWTLIGSLAKTSDLVTFRDYSAASGVKYQYAMTQMADRFGDYVESNIASSAIFTVQPQAESYWMIDDVTPSNSFPLFQVSADTFDEEYEEATYNVIGRGRHYDYGDRLGYSGSLTCQLRPRQIGQVERWNWIINPSISYADPGPTPNNWILTTAGTAGNITQDFINTQDPAASNTELQYRISTDGLGTATTDQIILSQVVVLDPSVSVGDICTFSIYVNTVQGDISGKQLEIGTSWETAASAVVRNDTVTNPTQIDTATSSAFGAPDYNSTANAITGQWKRYSITNARPATATQCRVRIVLKGTGSGIVAAKQLVVDGAQFEKQPAALEYFDGRRLGPVWLGIPDLSQSYTTGFYSARDQRMEIEAFKARKTSVLLRTPFGDYFRVALSNVGVTRIAGTGPTEISDVTIPYKEVAF